jgi:phage baseplate assembly protein W
MTRFLGYPYPITKTPKGYFYSQDGINTIKSDLLQLILTNPGERIMNPEFGTPLKRLLFEPNDFSARLQARNIIIDSINKWEPRIVIDKIEVSSQIDKTSLNKFDDNSEIENILFIRILFRDPEDLANVQELVLEVPLNGGL